MLNRAAVSSIRAYRRWISPYKGFRCAHAVRHGGPSCSAFAEAALLDETPMNALGEIRARFRACKLAAIELTAIAQQTEQDPSGNRRHRRSDKCSGFSEMQPCGSGKSCDATPDCDFCSCG